MIEQCCGRVKFYLGENGRLLCCEVNVCDNIDMHGCVSFNEQMCFLSILTKVFNRLLEASADIKSGFGLPSDVTEPKMPSQGVCYFAV